MSQDKSKASTQQHLDVEDITENLVILNQGNVAMIMTTTAVNFDILSEAEQDATIYAYAAFLNSLSFPLQVLVRSKKADITSYYHHLEESMRNQPNPDLKKQIQKYMEFIKSTVQQKTVLDKKFYLIITFSPLELGLRGLRKQPANKNKSKAHIIKEAKVNLFPKRDHIIKQTARLGLTANQLNTKELIELFYDIYNPAPTGTQRIILDTSSLATPLVKPAVESPAPYQDAPVTHPESDRRVESPLPVQTPDNQQPTLSPKPEVQTPTSSPTSQNQPVNQQEALQKLQQVTSNAAQFINERQQATSQNQPISNQQNLQPRSANTQQQIAKPTPTLRNQT